MHSEHQLSGDHHCCCWCVTSIKWLQAKDGQQVDTPSRYCTTSVSCWIAVLISYWTSMWWDSVNSPLRGGRASSYEQKSGFGDHNAEGPPRTIVNALRWWRLLGKAPAGTASNSPHILPPLPKPPLSSNSKRVITRVQEMLNKARAAVIFIVKHILN